MGYWRERLVIPAAAALLLATNPALAQTTMSSVKQDRLDAQAYQDLLVAIPSPFELQQAYIGSLLALPDVPPSLDPSTITGFPTGTAPSKPAPVAQGQGGSGSVPTVPGGNPAAIAQTILQGLSLIEAGANSQKPPQNKPPAAAANLPAATPKPPAAAAQPTAPASVMAAIEAMFERLRQQEQTRVLAATAAAREAAIAALKPPSFNAAPAVLPAAFTPPPSSKQDAAAANLLKQPGVVAAVRDMNVTAALKGWDAAFAAAWPDYAANNSYHPASSFYGTFDGTALAVMPDGTRSTGNLNMTFYFDYSEVYGGMTFASANPNLAGNLTFDTSFSGGATGIINNNAAAFGGALSNGEWSSDFYGSLGDIVAGNWNATITGGPNAGIVVGKFGGQK